MNRIRNILHSYLSYMRTTLYGGVLGLVAALVYISLRKDKESDSIIPTLMVMGAVLLGFGILELPWERGIVYLKDKRNHLNVRIRNKRWGIGQVSNGAMYGLRLKKTFAQSIGLSTALLYTLVKFLGFLGMVAEYFARLIQMLR